MINKYTYQSYYLCVLVCVCHTVLWMCRGQAVPVEWPPLCPLTPAPAGRDCVNIFFLTVPNDRRCVCVCVYCKLCTVYCNSLNLELLFQRDAEGQRLKPEVCSAQQQRLHRIPEWIFLSG